MSLEENKAILRHIMSEMNKGNFAIIDKLFADSFIYHGPFGIELRGRENLKKFAADFVAAFPDFHMTIEDMIAENDRVVTRMKIEGTHKGEFAGIAPMARRSPLPQPLLLNLKTARKSNHGTAGIRQACFSSLGAIPSFGE